MKGIQSRLLLGAVISLAACGGSGGSDGNNSSGSGEPQDARVVSMSLDNSVLLVGEIGTLSIEPTFAKSRVAAGERVAIVLRLPQGVRYQQEGSAIQTTSGFRGVGAVVTKCADGTSFAALDLGSAELADSQDPDGAEDADTRLIIGMVAESPTAPVPVQAAAADNSLGFSCDSGFEQEDEVDVEVR